MATTALIVALLVMSVFASIRIGLLVFTFVGNLDLPLSFENLSALLLPYLSLAYCLGIVINRLCDFRFKSSERCKRGVLSKKRPRMQDYPLLAHVSAYDSKQIKLQSA